MRIKIIVIVIGVGFSNKSRKVFLLLVVVVVGGGGGVHGGLYGVRE